ncbi:hypothetical protein [Halobacillus salinus]|nr:hypothetical protein [Halobacillus salinus]
MNRKMLILVMALLLLNPLSALAEEKETPGPKSPKETHLSEN